MNITRKEIASLVFPYAVSVFRTTAGPKVVIATEMPDRCLIVDANDLGQEVVWDDKGGCMNVWQINDSGDFFACLETYKGFNSRNACIAKVSRQAGGWASERFIDLPFLHRFCMVEVGHERFIIASSLCQEKASREDWSQAGTTYLVRLPPDLSRPGDLTPLLPGIHKNHGMYKGRHCGREVVMISGEEGLFEIVIPDTPDGEWPHRCLIQREISDMVVFDIDGDGVEEIITLEKFHGGRLVINKAGEDGWEPVYSYPVEFAHALWSGLIFGVRSIVVGYRGANAALVLLQPKAKRGDDFLMNVTVIDEHEGPTNFDVYDRGDVFAIFSCSGSRDRVVLYELRPD